MSFDILISFMLAFSMQNLTENDIQARTHIQRGRIASKASDFLARHWTLTKFACAPAVLSAAFHSKRPASRYEAMKASFRTLRNFGQFKSFVKFTNNIDDVVDTMPPEQRLALGEAKLGNQPCDFLQKMGLTRYFNLVRQMDEAGVITTAESISFSNIYACLLQDSARAEIEYKRTGSASSRVAMTEANMVLLQVLLSHMIQHFMPDSQIRALSQDSALTKEVAVQAFPHVASIGRLAEMCDDLNDFFTDIQQERETGILTPNWIATEIANQGVLYGSDGQLNPELSGFLDHHRSNPSGIPISVAPDFLKKAIEIGNADLEQSATSLPKLEGQAIMIIWDSILKAGLKSPMHPDVLKGSVFEKEPSCDLV